MCCSPHDLYQRMPLRSLLVVAYLAMYQTLHPAAAAPIDEFRLTDIEQKIRELENTTREQARLITQLQQATGNKVVSLPTPANGAASSSEQRWLNAANWNRLKPGMSELQVIELLGAPTQLRVADTNQGRTLLYALEIGRSGFLTGRVSISNGVVATIEIPTLK